MGGKEKKTKLMLYSTLVEIEVEVGVELGNNKNEQTTKNEDNQQNENVLATS